MLYIIGTAGAVLILVFVFLKLVWRPGNPNTAMAISGFGIKGDGNVGFKLKVSKGALVLPGLQTVKTLGLGSRRAEMDLPCVSAQNIPLKVRAVATYKVGDNDESVVNAVRQFINGDERYLQETVDGLLEAHLRAIVGSTTVEDALHNRSELASQVLEHLTDDMAQYGLIGSSVLIQRIEENDYIKNLGKPQEADVAAKARVAAANRDLEATKAEQEAQAQMAEARRTSEVQQAGYQAEVSRASAESAQSGPLQEARSHQAVVEQQTEVARREADREQQRLQATVVRPAEAGRLATVAAAEADKQRRILEAEATAATARQVGQAEADATQARGEAEGAALRAKGLAEAAAIQARAEALATNQDAVINQRLAEQLPEIVAAGAEAFKGVGNMVVLNGAEGLNASLASILTQGVASFQALKKGMVVKTEESHKDDKVESSAQAS